MEMKKAHEEHENDERWLITYADLITLLMVFFVVMYSMSRTDAEKFKALASGLSHVFGKPALSSVGTGGQPISGNSILPNKADGDARHGTRNKGSEGDVRTRRIKALKNDLDALMAKRGLSESVTTKVDPKGPKLVMELSDSLLFDPGSAELTPAAVELLKPVAEVLGARDYNIHVEGHTDNVPISGTYKNNFELSTARAVNVIMALTDAAGLPPDMFSASGYGEYRPVATNDTPEGRSKNRRVDFVIYDENALDAMLGSTISDEPEQDVAALDADPASDSVTGQTDVPATGGETGAAHSNTAAAGPHAEPSTGPAEPAASDHADTAHSRDGATHADAPTAAEGLPSAEPTHAPVLDAPASTHAGQVPEASHSLGSVLALPPVKSTAIH
ncbi:MAG: OmpA family protein [Candidatus Hydrogenedentes bacterium]|nr:OmpA family protein [Candidatus Hydrogenedentota bacterium]